MRFPRGQRGLAPRRDAPVENRTSAEWQQIGYSPVGAISRPAIRPTAIAAQGGRTTRALGNFLAIFDRLGRGRVMRGLLVILLIPQRAADRHRSRCELDDLRELHRESVRMARKNKCARVLMR